MLLTSSQVSFILSTLIVMVFTVALFLAGYILQQQTVQSLSNEIKPRMQARITPLSQRHGLSLPSQFATSSVESFVVAKTTNSALGVQSSAPAERGGEDAEDVVRNQLSSGQVLADVEQKLVGSVGPEEWRERLRAEEDARLVSGQERFEAEGEDFFSVRKRTSKHGGPVGAERR